LFFRRAADTDIARSTVAVEAERGEVRMQGYVASVWRYRHFWLALVGMDLRTRYRRSVLGIGWSLLNPICMTIVLCLVFQHVFGRDNVQDYAPQVMAGLAFWNFFLAVTQHSCACFYQGESYIRQCPTPLAIYPLRSALGGAVHLSLALTVVIGVSWIFHGFGNFLPLLSLIPSMLLLFVFGWSMALLLGFANVFFNDTQHITEVVCQILFYATPIIYPPEIVGTRMGGIMAINPLGKFVQLIREPVLEGKIPALQTYALAGATTLVVFSLASWVLSRYQERLVFRL
jgi:ABC-type polysaccharide/polyol phosphate export permease